MSDIGVIFADSYVAGNVEAEEATESRDEGQTNSRDSIHVSKQFVRWLEMNLHSEIIMIKTALCHGAMFIGSGQDMVQLPLNIRRPWHTHLEDRKSG